MDKITKEEFAVLEFLRKHKQDDFGHLDFCIGQFFHTLPAFPDAIKWIKNVCRRLEIRGLVVMEQSSVSIVEYPPII